MGYLIATDMVSALTGASIRQLDHWARTGLLTPSGEQARGKGTKRRYTFMDVVAVKAVVALRDYGCPLQKIRTAVRYLRKEYPDESTARKLARTTLLTDGRKVYILTQQRKIMEIVTRQHVWSVALGKLVTEAREQVRALPAKWIETVRISGKNYHLVVVRDADTDTYTVQCRELPGAIEQGGTVKQAMANGKEAIRSVLAFMKKRTKTGRRYVQAG